MPDQDGLLVERFQLPGDVVCDLGHAVPGDRTGVPPRRLGRLRVPRPVGGDGVVAVVAEELHPVVPRFGVEPEAVHEHDRSPGVLFRRHDCSPFCPNRCNAAPGRTIRGAVHRRLTPGVVVDVRLDGDTRVVTFANGLVAREPLVDLDDEARRLAYAAVGGRATHYNASMQVFAAEEGRSRLVWIIDLLPHELAGPVRAIAEQALRVAKQTLER